MRSSKRQRWLVFLVATLGFLVRSFAQTPPIEFPRISGATKVDARLTADLYLGRQRIEFEGAGLQAVGLEMHNLAMGHALPRGDEPGYSWLCFTVALGSHAERWWLMSDDEFGGAPDYAITGVYAEQLKPSGAPTTTCPEPPSQYLAASLDGSLWVGSRAATIKHLFGPEPPPTGWHRYSNVTRRLDSHGAEWFVQSWLDVKVEGGVIVALRAVQMTGS